MTPPPLQKEEGPPAVPPQPRDGEAHPAALSPQRQQGGGASSAPSPPAESPGALRILKSVGESAGVITALAFISGWLYWATYYAAFGLNPLTLDFPVAVVSVSQLQVIVRDWKTEQDLHAVLIRVLTVCTVLIVLFALARMRRHPSAAAPLILLALGIPVGTLWLGLHDAELDAGCNSRLPTVAFLLTNPPDDADDQPACLNNTLGCKLILHFGNVYHYFGSPECGDNTASALPPSLATGEVLESEIKMVRIDRTLGW